MIAFAEPGPRRGRSDFARASRIFRRILATIEATETRRDRLLLRGRDAGADALDAHVGVLARRLDAVRNRVGAIVRRERTDRRWNPAREGARA